MPLPKRPVRRGTIAVAAVSAALLVAPQAQSFEAIAIGTRHHLECFGLMLSDPTRHAQECLPFRGGPSTGSIISQGGDGTAAAPVVVAPPPPPPPPPEPVVSGEPEPENPGSGPALG